MVMPVPAGSWTREMVFALPDDGNRYELFDGELLVTPAPTGLHQIAISKLWGALFTYVELHRLGEIMTSPADLHLGGDQLSQPDLFVMPWLPGGRRLWTAFPNPILVVEILSPSSERFDRTVKRPRFQRAGIPEYWIVDLDRRAVERWRPTDQDAELLDQALTWRPDRAVPALTIALPRYFYEVWGE